MQTTVHLRPWRKSDLDTLVLHANNPRIAQNLTDHFPHPYSRQDGEGFIKRAQQQDPTQILAMEVEGVPCGSIGIFPQHDIFRKNAELGYWLAEPYWGRGITPEAIRQMVRYAFDTFEIDRIFARPFGSNAASKRVLEKVGFVLEATFEKTIYKNGVYEDECIYALRRSEIE